VSSAVSDAEILPRVWADYALELVRYQGCANAPTLSRAHRRLLNLLRFLLAGPGHRDLNESAAKVIASAAPSITEWHRIIAAMTKAPPRDDHVDKKFRPEVTPDARRLNLLSHFRAKQYSEINPSAREAAGLLKTLTRLGIGAKITESNNANPDVVVDTLDIRLAFQSHIQGVLITSRVIDIIWGYTIAWFPLMPVYSWVWNTDDIITAIAPNERMSVLHVINRNNSMAVANFEERTYQLFELPRHRDLAPIAFLTHADLVGSTDDNIVIETTIDHETWGAPTPALAYLDHGDCICVNAPSCQLIKWDDEQKMLQLRRYGACDPNNPSAQVRTTTLVRAAVESAIRLNDGPPFLLIACIRNTVFLLRGSTQDGMWLLVFEIREHKDRLTFFHTLTITHHVLKACCDEMYDEMYAIDEHRLLLYSWSESRLVAFTTDQGGDALWSRRFEGSVAVLNGDVYLADEGGHEVTVYETATY